MSGSQQLLLGTGVSAVAANYIEDVFSTWLYTGNGSTQVINSGVDLAAKGGLVWFKSRNNSTFANSPNCLTDSVTGFSKYLISEQTQFQQNWGADGPVPKSYGFDLPINGSVPYTNYLTGSTYVAWTFAKQPKFFDVVTYTGNGGSQTISHSLGSAPGCIIIKKLDSTTFNAGWAVYHRSLTNPDNYYLVLNTTAAQTNYGAPFISSVSSTSFTVDGASGLLGLNGSSYVAYLFAHNAGGFGLTGTDNVISCGSYTGNGSSTGPTITLGYEPQWLMIKAATRAGNWIMYDNMRGMPTAPSVEWADLIANSSAAENAGMSVDYNALTATGFQILNNQSELNNNGDTYIYIAIRRGPMKTPTSGTSVYTSSTGTNSATIPTFTANFPVDWIFAKNPAATFSWEVAQRLTGGYGLAFNSTAAQSGPLSDYVFDSNIGAWTNYPNTFRSWLFRRAPGFFDVVCYTGTGANRTVTHNLGVVPELMIVKRRDSAGAWNVWNTYIASLDAANVMQLESTDAVGPVASVFNSTSPTSSVFSLGTAARSNASGGTFVAYLFASCPGVSKVTNFTGTGSLQTINCGFTGGARWVLIKRTDAAGDWYVWDSARGISSGNDPYLLLNSTAAEVTTTNWVDTTSTGFQVTAAAGNNVNINGASYIALAIA